MVKRAAKAWDRFWFAPADPTVLGLIRIICGLLVLYTHITYSFGLMDWVGPNGWLDAQGLREWREEMPVVPQPPDWETPSGEPLEGGNEDRRAVLEYYDRWGVDPRQVADKGFYGWSIWDNIADPNWAAVLHGLCLLVMLLFTLGVATRFTAVLTWLAAMSYMHRMPFTLFGLDAIISLALLYLAIGPSGAALSVDRLLARWRAAKANQKPTPPPPSASANFALRLIQVHFCMIYLTAGLAKLLGTSWWNGSAFWGTLANHEMSPFRVPGYVELLRFLAQHRWLLETVQFGGTFFTLAVEIGFPFLVWNQRLRGWMIGAAVLLHLGIALGMDLTMFSLMMVTLLLAFLPPEPVHRLLDWLFRGKAELRLNYDSRAPGQARAAALARTFDVWDRVTLEDQNNGKPGTRLKLTGPDGRTFTGYAAFEKLTRSLRVLWPVALLTWLPGANLIGRRLFPEVV